MKKGYIYNIMVGSPKDVMDFVQIAIECIHKWNVLNSDDKNIALIPHHWTSSAYPSLKQSAQKELNSQLINKSDALVAIFGSRIGSPTEDNISGTVEEIEEHRKTNKPVMIFFCDNLSSTEDLCQIQKLFEYRQTVNGLYETFNTKEDFEKKFSSKLQLLIQNEFKYQEEEKNNNSENQIKFSEDEIELTKKWCNAKSNYFSKTAFINGKVLFSFSGLALETTSPKEEAQWDDYIDRMLKYGFMIMDGFNKQGKPKYKLTLKAFDYFLEGNKDN